MKIYNKENEEERKIELHIIKCSYSNVVWGRQKAKEERVVSYFAMVGFVIERFYSFFLGQIC